MGPDAPVVCGGMSIRQVAAKTGTPAGSVAAHAARHQWGAQRRQLAAVKGESTADDKEQLVRAIVQENRLKTLEAESKAARLLAERCLKIIEEGGIPVRLLSDITESQEYRARLWPSVQPVEVSGALECILPAALNLRGRESWRCPVADSVPPLLTPPT
jgi:hypothetical protein